METKCLITTQAAKVVVMVFTIQPSTHHENKMSNYNPRHKGSCDGFEGLLPYAVEEGCSLESYYTLTIKVALQGSLKLVLAFSISLLEKKIIERVQ